MVIETNHCTNEVNNCLIDYSCPLEANTTPTLCISLPKISGCQIQIGGSCKLCHNFYYLNKGKCLPCGGDCVACYSSTICGICLMSNKMEPTISGVCKQKCPKLLNNQYCNDGIARTCQSWLVTECKCGTHKFCASCSTLNECASCLPGFKLVGNECQQCQKGYSPFQGLCIKNINYGGGSLLPPKPDPLIPESTQTYLIISVIIGISIGASIFFLGIIGFVVYILKNKQKVLVNINIEKLQEI